MNNSPLRPIRHGFSVDQEVHIPPSKSYSNRALIAAALADGVSLLVHPSMSDDTKVLTEGLKQFGVKIRDIPEGLEVTGCGGNVNAPTREIFLGNAGTAMRFLTSFATLAQGETMLNGDARMRQRPLNDLLESLRSAGIKCSGNNGCPPVKITGGNFSGGPIDMKADISSQFVSSILLAAPYAKHPLLLRLHGNTRSLPYIDMTLHVMRSFGAKVESLDASTFTVSNTDRYIGHTFEIEGDASSATYFWAAAAITGGRVVITNLSTESLQGDLKFLKTLSDMGCHVRHDEHSIEVQGGTLYGIEVDMNDLPDCVPTLAVLAAFAGSPTTILNVGHLRYKETNRLTALATELTKIGARVEVFEDGLTIHPQQLHGAIIETYNDHRIAMSFAVAGLRIPGIEIMNPMCVSKSFPNFWDEFSKLEQKE
jgi:3-phosphoshikimate 1-carboxyvinyltransferase